MLVRLMQESIYNFASNLETIFSPVLELIEVHSVPSIFDDAGIAHTSSSKCMKKLVINALSIYRNGRKSCSQYYFSCLVACMTANSIQMNVLGFVSCLCYCKQTIYCYMWYCKIYFEECWLIESKDFEDVFSFKSIRWLVEASITLDTSNNFLFCSGIQLANFNVLVYGNQHKVNTDY